MKENKLEVIIGACVLAVALGFVIFLYQTTGFSVSDSRHYELKADFRSADGIHVGTDVRPDDSAVTVSSEGLLGGNFIEIIPGASFEYMQPGDEFLDTQGSVSLISLLLKFVSGSDN